MTTEPTMVSIVLNFAPIAMTATECEAAPEPRAVSYHNNEFVRSWASDEGVSLEQAMDEFEREWGAYADELGAMFSGLVVFQRVITTTFPMGEAAVIVSAEKYTSRSSSLFGVLSKAFKKDKHGDPVFEVKLVDHPGETRPVALGAWLRQAVRDIKWSISNTYFLSPKALAHD